jgi:hypothetical protein
VLKLQVSQPWQHDVQAEAAAAAAAAAALRQGDAAFAAGVEAQLAHALSGEGDYASINALLKQLHDERLQRMTVAGLSSTARAQSVCDPSS